MKVVAYVPAFNEADILWWTLRHLQIKQGVIAHVIDNWSTDGTERVAREMLAKYEKFPEEGPTLTYDWTAILNRVSELAAESGADWCMTCDADELRRAPLNWDKPITLRAALKTVDKEGYNAVDFRVWNFRVTDDSWDGSQNPEEHFFFHDPIPSHYDRQRHVKAWKNTGQRVDLASSGGHVAWFEGMKVYPHKFVLKHYPVRNKEQGERKIFQERIARFRDDEKFEKGFHAQYLGLPMQWEGARLLPQLIANPKDLVEWKGL